MLQNFLAHDTTTTPLPRIYTGPTLWKKRLNSAQWKNNANEPPYLTVASDNVHVRYSTYQYAAVLPAAVAGVGLHVDTTAFLVGFGF